MRSRNQGMLYLPSLQARGLVKPFFKTKNGCTIIIYNQRQHASRIFVRDELTNLNARGTRTAVLLGLCMGRGTRRRLLAVGRCTPARAGHGPASACVRPRKAQPADPARASIRGISVQRNACARAPGRPSRSLSVDSGVPWFPCFQYVLAGD